MVILRMIIFSSSSEVCRCYRPDSATSFLSFKWFEVSTSWLAFISNIAWSWLLLPSIIYVTAALWWFIFNNMIYHMYIKIQKFYQLNHLNNFLMDQNLSPYLVTFNVLIYCFNHVSIVQPWKWLEGKVLPPTPTHPGGQFAALNSEEMINEWVGFHIRYCPLTRLTRLPHYGWNVNFQFNHAKLQFECFN